MRVVAPSLVMPLLYFGPGSLVLASEILVRFHSAIPDATETQFASRVGHPLEAAAGIAFLTPHLRFRSRRAWIVGNAVAVGHWSAQVVVLTPPWFAFQGQLDVIHTVSLGALATVR